MAAFAERAIQPVNKIFHQDIEDYGNNYNHKLT